MKNNLLIIRGGAVKTQEDGVVEGQGIVFTSENDPDQSSYRDYFTTDSFVRKSSEFIVPMYYNHGLGPIKQEIGEAVLSKTDTGWNAVGKFYMDDPVAKSVYDAVKSSQHGFSTGALQHLVEREAKSNQTNFLKRWVVGEISLTETPAEPKAVVEYIKSINPDTGKIEFADMWEELESKKDKNQVVIAIYNEEGKEIWNDESGEPIPDSAKSIEIKYASGSVTYYVSSYDETSETGTSVEVYQWGGPETFVDAMQKIIDSARAGMKSESKPEELDFEERVAEIVKKLTAAQSPEAKADENELAELRKELTDAKEGLNASEDALTKAKERIAQLEILADAKKTLDKYKGKK